ncbi:hypothetical protein KR767_13275 [Luteibacter anthropi]|uniref:hypothetical protein n=1 Tax=Luteibacter anthropi TaxID=564369 RepID=UPI002032D1E5|nr:hypothetical protein [Luteibacter anthropi]URX61056.1 hypothetical protein KR767_13275 [Luteibacter anthropi]
MKFIFLAIVGAMIPWAAQALPDASNRSDAYPKAFSFNGIPAPDTLFHQQIPLLKKQASTGTADASAKAASLYEGLRKCRDLREQSPGGEADAYCKGVTQADLDSAFSWLTTAAEGGLPEATYVYATSAMDEEKRLLGTRASTSIKYEVVGKSRNYLETLAQSCNVDALRTLYDQRLKGGSLYEKDAAKAYAFQTELATLKPALIAKPERDSLASQLTPEQTSAAEAEVATYLSSRCR